MFGEEEAVQWLSLGFGWLLPLPKTHQNTFIPKGGGRRWEEGRREEERGKEGRRKEERGEEGIKWKSREER